MSTLNTISYSELLAWAVSNKSMSLHARVRYPDDTWPLHLRLMKFYAPDAILIYGNEVDNPFHHPVMVVLAVIKDGKIYGYGKYFPVVEGEKVPVVLLTDKMDEYQAAAKKSFADWYSTLPDNYQLSTDDLEQSDRIAFSELVDHDPRDIKEEYKPDVVLNRDDMLDVIAGYKTLEDAIGDRFSVIRGTMIQEKAIRKRAVKCVHSEKFFSKEERVVFDTVRKTSCQDLILEFEHDRNSGFANISLNALKHSLKNLGLFNAYSFSDFREGKALEAAFHIQNGQFIPMSYISKIKTRNGREIYSRKG